MALMFLTFQVSKEKERERRYSRIHNPLSTHVCNPTVCIFVASKLFRVQSYQHFCADAAMPRECAMCCSLQGWGQSRRSPQGKGVFVLLSRGCIAVVAAIESWIEMGP